MSYHETDISTFVGSWDEYRTLDFGELYPNCTTNSPSTRNDAWCNSATGLSQISECFPLSAATASIWSQQHCYPQLPYPSNLQAINPAWANCADSNLVDDRHGIYDPPRTLAPAPVLAPTPTKDKSVPSSAAPVPRPVQPGPPITAPPRVPSSVNLPENDQQNGNTALPKDSAIADPPYSQTSTSDDLQPDSDDFPGIPSSTVDPANGPVQSTGGTQKGIVGPAKTSMDGDTGSGNGVLDVNPGSAGGPAAAQVATTIDGHIVQAVSSSPGVFLVDGELLTVGGSPVTVSGTPLALNSNNYLVFGTSTLQDPVPTPASPQVSYFTVGSETLTFSSGLLMAAGKTLEADQSGITVDGTSVSLAQSALQIGASTIALDPPASLSSPTVTTVAGRPITILPTAVFIADTTLTSNAPGITILGTPISFGSNGLIIGTSTISLSIPTSNSVATIAGQAVNLALGGVSIAGTTLKIDDPAITISGTPVSLGVSGLILGTSTVPLPAPSSGSVITLAGQAATLYPALGQLAIAGTTVRIGGPAVTISGTPIALESSVLIAGTSTLPFPGIGPFSTQGIGDFIFAGLNGGLTTTPIAPSSTGSSNQTQKNSTGLAGVTEPFLGSASRVKTRGSTLGAVLLLAIFQREVLRI
ncbi:hypothetical protein MMC28_002782 [Mycoblastus sanguinarius]|nr:hypothetical protein [Mycoblastus sanguinarius]